VVLENDGELQFDRSCGNEEVAAYIQGAEENPT
jgi:hypothetical protein